MDKQSGSHSPISAGLLSLTGGMLDAYTYVQRGGVFANAQTGNIVKLGILLAQGKVTEAFGCYRLAMRELPQGTVREQLRRLILDDLVRGQAKLRVIAAKTDAGEYLDGWLDKYGSLKEIQSLVR